MDFVGDSDGYDNRKALLSVWDTAGQERFRALGSAFYRGADAVLICFDASLDDERQLERELREWYDDFVGKSALTLEQQRSFAWIAVGCKADLRTDGKTIPRRRVRQILDSIVGRGRSTDDTATTIGMDSSGDAPPAKPEEVLSRQGIHKEDDRHLGLPEEDAEEEDVTPRGEPDERQAGLHSTEQDAKPPTAEAEEHHPRSSSEEQHKSYSIDEQDDDTHTPQPPTPPNDQPTHLPFPSSSSSPKTPIKTRLHAHTQRDRFDSNISMASSSQLSVYHTPRNSNFFGSSTLGVGQSAASGTRWNASSAMLSSTASSSVGTIGKGWPPKGKERENGHVDESPALNGRADQQDNSTTATTTTTIPIKPRRLSTASDQSILDFSTDERDKRDAFSPSPPPHPSRGFSLFYTSALTGENVHAVFNHVVSRVGHRWTYEEYHSTLQLQRRRRLAELEKRKAGNRESLWRSTLRLGRMGGGGGGDNGRDGMIDLLSTQEDEDIKRINDETRRMVRVSDGKVDDAQRGLGGCC